jgi:hypothetical protein
MRPGNGWGIRRRRVVAALAPILGVMAVAWMYRSRRGPRAKPEPSEAGTADLQSLDAVRAHMESLRREIGGRLETQNTVWRTLVAGLAAVLILKEDIDIGRFLPLVPILGAVLATVWLNNQLMIVRGGYSLGLDEERIGRLVGDPAFLQHETVLWTWRKGLAQRRWAWWTLWAVGAAVQLVAIFLLWEESALPKGPGPYGAVLGAAVIVAGISAFLLWNLLNLFTTRRNLPEPDCLLQ